MPRFMLDRQVSTPAGYAERHCLLVSYRLPLLRHCFVICHAPTEDGRPPAVAELLAFSLAEAERLAEACAGKSQAFMLIHSGVAIRKRAGWHLHVFVVERRWQKAWVYGVLMGKNAALTLYQGLPKLRRPAWARSKSQRGTEAGS